MAEQLKLVLREDLSGEANPSGEVSSFDLLSVLAYNGWRQKIAASDDESAFLDEAMTLHFSSSSDNALSSTVQDFDQYLRNAQRYYQNPVTQYGIWLRAQLPGETSARQALILDAKRGEAAVVDPFIDQHVLYEYPLGLRRTPFWESLQTIVRGAVTVDSVGGYVQLNGATEDQVDGDVPARIARALLTSGISSELTRFWLGFRTDRFGVVENFISKWEAEDGALGTDTATTTANDSTASGASPKSIRCTFGTVATLTQRWTMLLSTAAPANPEDQKGDFLVIGRFKCTDGSTTARVRLRSGFANSSQMRASPRVLVSGSSWNMYELGQVTFPSTGRGWEQLDFIDQQALAIDAERTAGSGSLDFDCIVLVPTAEGYLTVDAGSHIVGSPRADRMDVYVKRLADLRTVAAATGDSIYFYSDIYATLAGNLPIGSKVYMSAAAARDGSSTLADQFAAEFSIYNRWLTLRGAE